MRIFNEPTPIHRRMPGAARALGHQPQYPLPVKALANAHIE